MSLREEGDRKEGVRRPVGMWDKQEGGSRAGPPPRGVRTARSCDSRLWPPGEWTGGKREGE